MLAISQCHDYEPIKVNESSNKPISPIKFLMDKAFCHNNQSGSACFSWQLFSVFHKAKVNEFFKSIFFSELFLEN